MLCSLVRSELLETILRIPSEFGAEAFEQVWHLDEICAIGDLFGSWMRLARHRGTVANLHPCYTRSAEALMAAGKDWAEVQQLPRVWLQVGVAPRSALRPRD